MVTFENGVVQEHRVETQQVKCGDIVKLSGQELVPVDMVLIFTSMFADGNSCYIETANLDGETNLKVRQAPVALRALAKQGVPSPVMFDGNIEFEPPNKNLNSFVGAMHLKSIPSIPLEADNVLLRGCLFSNTEWAYGIAIYTGQETKIQMNNRHADSKLSQIEQYANTAVIVIFLLQSLLVFISVISIYVMGYDDISKVIRFHLSTPPAL